MNSVMVIGAGSHCLSRALVEALSDLALKVVVATPGDTGAYTFNLHCHTVNGYSQTEQHKRAMREHFKHVHAGIQQRRKALTNFHQEKHSRMAHKQATKRRNRFVQSGW